MTGSGGTGHQLRGLGALDRSEVFRREEDFAAVFAIVDWVLDEGDGRFFLTFMSTGRLTVATMPTTFQIAEVAQRSGFTPATLRYHEDIGLLAPASRTDAGDRRNDETSLERLQGVTARRALDDGRLRLEFGPNTEVTKIARLAAAEQGCCRFFSVALVIDDRGAALEVHAPPDAQPVLAAVFGTAA